jgi:hypothetical protein
MIFEADLVDWYGPVPVACGVTGEMQKQIVPTERHIRTDVV